MQNEQQTPTKNIFVIAAVIVAVVCAVFFLRGCYGGTEDSNINAGIDSVRAGITDSADSNTKLQEQLHRITSTVSSVKESVERGEAAITNAESAANQNANNLDDAERAIKNCQRIVKQIKQRNEITGTQP